MAAAMGAVDLSGELALQEAQQKPTPQAKAINSPHGRKKGRVVSIRGNDVFIDVPGGCPSAINHSAEPMQPTTTSVVVSRTTTLRAVMTSPAIALDMSSPNFVVTFDLIAFRFDRRWRTALLVVSDRSAVQQS